MKREQSHLQTDANHKESERNDYCPGVEHFGKTLSQVRHVERTGHYVQQANADEYERCPESSHHQVGIGCGKSAPILPQADEHIRRQS